MTKTIRAHIWNLTTTATVRKMQETIRVAQTLTGEQVRTRISRKLTRLATKRHGNRERNSVNEVFDKKKIGSKSEDNSKSREHRRAAIEAQVSPWSLRSDSSLCRRCAVSKEIIEKATGCWFDSVEKRKCLENVSRQKRGIGRFAKALQENQDRKYKELLDTSEYTKKKRSGLLETMHGAEGEVEDRSSRRSSNEYFPGRGDLAQSDLGSRK